MKEKEVVMEKEWQQFWRNSSSSSNSSNSNSSNKSTVDTMSVLIFMAR